MKYWNKQGTLGDGLIRKEKNCHTVTFFQYRIGTGQTGLNVADRFNHKFSHNEPMLRGGLKYFVIRHVLEGETWLATDGSGKNY